MYFKTINLDFMNLNSNKKDNNEFVIKLENIIKKTNIEKRKLNKILSQMNEQIKKWETQKESNSDNNLTT